MRRFKWTFWVGLILSIVGALGMFSAWYYFNQTEDVAYVKSYVPAGAAINVDNIIYKPVRIQNLPDSYLSQQELLSKEWRATDGIQTTDPLTISKVTDQVPLIINSDQGIVSYSFKNSGLLTYINPGDKVTVIDNQNILKDVLVLGKADKDANLIALLPTLQANARKESQGLLDAAQSFLDNTAVTQPAALILLLDIEQTKTLYNMTEPIIRLDRRELLTEVIKNIQEEDMEGGGEDATSPDNNEPR